MSARAQAELERAAAEVSCLDGVRWEWRAAGDYCGGLWRRRGWYALLGDRRYYAGRSTGFAHTWISVCAREGAPYCRVERGTH